MTDHDDDQGDGGDVYTDLREQITVAIREIVSDETTRNWESFAALLGCQMGNCSKLVAAISGERAGVAMLVGDIDDRHVEELADGLASIFTIVMGELLGHGQE